MTSNNQVAPSFLEGAKPPNLTTSLTRRKMVKRLGMVAVVGSVAVGVSPTFAMASDDSVSSVATSNRKPSGFNVLLVHGAFADASSWSEVVALLQKEGHIVLAVQLSLTGLADDVAVVRQALASLTGPTVVAGHSYGGAVISGAATGVANIIGLVYASAYVPDEGESLGGLNSLFPTPLLGSHLLPSYRAGFGWIDPVYFPEVFAADIEPSKARVLAVSQKPIAFNCFGELAGPAAWKTLPSWYLVSKQDKAINPDLERFMAKRIKATTIEVNSSHASPVSHPCEVVGLIEAAIKQYQKKH